ncbi:MAG TPA: nucleoside permease [Candidatus Acidoferrum sp.]|nr:nucleoside permease [Candidatus Acidoferrum sp.]
MLFSMRVRLSLMMFLEYFIWGAWYVTLGTWLGQQLHFSGEQIGVVAGTTALGAAISPFLVGLMADELFANQRLLAALHGIGGLLLWFASAQTAFGPMYALLLIYSLCYMPTMALTNALAFRQMKDPKRDFGSIRVLGTAGWIVAGLLIGFLRVEPTAIPIRIAGAASMLMAIYSLTLPHTPPLRSAHGFKLSNIFPPEAFTLFKDRNFSVFALASFLICIPLQFYYTFTNPFLNEIGMQNAAGKMTMGQMSELLFMVTLPWFFRRVGVKYTLMLGMFAWVVRYISFGTGNTGSFVALLYLGIVLHGICYDFFFVTGQVYVDQKAPLALRAVAQGLIYFITYGIGMFVGSWICGAIVDRYAKSLPSGGGLHDWRSIWMVPAIASAVVLLFFWVGFRREERAPEPPVPVAEASLTR